MFKFLPALALVFSFSPAAAFDCVDLKPTPPKNDTTTFTGKLDASVDGLFAKLASVGTKVEGTYNQIATNVLAELPNADKLYMWERVLFLECQLLSEAKDVSSKDKIQMVGELYQKFNAPPPELVPVNTTPATTGPVLINKGDNSKLIQGNGNSIDSNNK